MTFAAIEYGSCQTGALGPGVPGDTPTKYLNSYWMAFGYGGGGQTIDLAAANRLYVAYKARIDSGESKNGIHVEYVKITDIKISIGFRATGPPYSPTPNELNNSEGAEIDILVGGIMSDFYGVSQFYEIYGDVVFSYERSAARPTKELIAGQAGDIIWYAMIPDSVGKWSVYYADQSGNNWVKITDIPETSPRYKFNGYCSVEWVPPEEMIGKKVKFFVGWRGISPMSGNWEWLVTKTASDLSVHSSDEFPPVVSIIMPLENDTVGRDLKVMWETKHVAIGGYTTVSVTKASDPAIVYLEEVLDDVSNGEYDLSWVLPDGADGQTVLVKVTYYNAGGTPVAFGGAPNVNVDFSGPPPPPPPPQGDNTALLIAAGVMLGTLGYFMMRKK